MLARPSSSIRLRSPRPSLMQQRWRRSSALARWPCHGCPVARSRCRQRSRSTSSGSNSIRASAPTGRVLPRATPARRPPTSISRNSPTTAAPRGWARRPRSSRPRCWRRPSAGGRLPAPIRHPPVPWPCNSVRSGRTQRRSFMHRMPVRVRRNRQLVMQPMTSPNGAPCTRRASRLHQRPHPIPTVRTRPRPTPTGPVPNFTKDQRRATRVWPTAASCTCPCSPVRSLAAMPPCVASANSS